MKIATLVLSLFGAASAFAPVANTASKTALNGAKDDLAALAKELNPVVGFWDPLKLSDEVFWDGTNEATIAFLRHSEIKHGRVAMAAFVGYCVQSNIHFPWKMTLAGDNYPSTDLSPEQQWDALPDAAKWQIILVIGFLEWYSEIPQGSPHYMRGGKPGDFPTFDAFRESVHPLPLNLFDPFGFSKNASEEKKAKGLVAEINNGRLAMLGIIGFLSADKIPGSVPMLKDIAIPYAGNPMDPFSS